METVVSYSCELCRMDGKSKEATHFCVNCEVYLCTEHTYNFEGHIIVPLSVLNEIEESEVQ